MLEHNRFSILIIDDTYTNVLILQKTLSHVGYDVLVANNGPEGRKLAEEHLPDLILLDIMMPEEDGFDTIVKLKECPATSSIPVIFLTALSDLDSKIKGFDLGAVDFITKPFHPSEIRARTRLHIKLSVATNALIKTQRERLRQVEHAQKAMLLRPEELPDAGFSVFYSSFQEAGGDFYDVIPVSDDTFGYFIADVAGHDIATGFLTAALKALLRQNCSPIYSPSEAMRMINEVLLDFLPDGKYLTACYILVDRAIDTATIVNMGHLPIIHQTASGIEILSYESDLLGAFPGVVYNEHKIDIDEGDRFFIYSDGLIESNDNKVLWSSDLNILKESIPETREALDSTIKNIYNYFAEKNKGKFEDDVVIFGIEV